MLDSEYSGDHSYDFDKCRAIWGLDNDCTEDVKVGYFDQSELNAENIRSLCKVTGNVALVIGFASPECDFLLISELFKQHLPKGAKFFLISTAGEVISDGSDKPFYLPDTEGRKKIVVQVFSRRMIKACQLVTVKLPNDDLKDNQIVMTVEERIDQIKDELSSVKVDFLIKPEDTIALAYVDGASSCEAVFIQAIYDSKRYPCVVAGGSSGGKDYLCTYLHDGNNLLEGYAIICLLKLQPNYKFGIFKSQGFKREPISFKIADANHAMRYITKVIDENMCVCNVVDYLKRKFECSSVAELEEKLVEYSFAIEINGDIFARSFKQIDEARGRVYFFCDIGLGEKLCLVKRISLIDSLQCDWQIFMKNKPKPFAGIVTDCVTRRVVNRHCLDEVTLFSNIKIGGFSSFGELLGVPINETLTAVFFFKVRDSTVFQDRYHDYFPVFYGECISYFLLRRLKQVQIVEELESRLMETLQMVQSADDDASREIEPNFEDRLAKLFAGDLLTMQDKVGIAPEGLDPSTSFHYNAVKNSISDVGMLVSYMQMMLDKLSTQREDLEKTMLDMKDSIDKYAKDELTDVYTRRAGYELIHQLMNKQINKHDVIVFAFLDINDLKIANDIAGHEEGDKYLKTVISLIQRRISDFDLICRYGGDEFIVIFPNGKEDNVHQLLHEVNCELEVLAQDDDKPYSMSFAFGTYVYSYEDSSFDDILRVLDQRMYKDKFEQKLKRNNLRVDKNNESK